MRPHRRYMNQNLLERKRYRLRANAAKEDTTATNAEDKTVITRLLKKYRLIPLFQMLT